VTVEEAFIIQKQGVIQAEEKYLTRDPTSTFGQVARRSKPLKPQLKTLEYYGEKKAVGKFDLSVPRQGGTKGPQKFKQDIDLPKNLSENTEPDLESRISDEQMSYIQLLGTTKERVSYLMTLPDSKDKMEVLDLIFKAESKSKTLTQSFKESLADEVSEDGGEEEIQAISEDDSKIQTQTAQLSSLRASSEGEKSKPPRKDTAKSALAEAVKKRTARRAEIAASLES